MLFDLLRYVCCDRYLRWWAFVVGACVPHSFTFDCIHRILPHLITIPFDSISVVDLTSTPPDPHLFHLRLHRLTHRFTVTPSAPHLPLLDVLFVCYGVCYATPAIPLLHWTAITVVPRAVIYPRCVTGVRFPTTFDFDSLRCCVTDFPATHTVITLLTASNCCSTSHGW